ncbi:MAG: hypothetical protein AAF939_02020 [Planctomycetota bacterium]
MMTLKCVKRIVLFLILVFAVNSPGRAQDDLENILKNGSFESFSDGQPMHWDFSSTNNGSLRPDSADKQKGTVSAFFDATKKSDARNFTNLVQSVPASELQGKRVRYRAAVKTSNLQPGSTVNLWFRVDRDVPEGSPATGAFDNMSDRPILSEEWDYYEIELDVDPDAEIILIGCFINGNGQAWIDDATLKVVGTDDQESDSESGDKTTNGSQSENRSDKNTQNSEADSNDRPTDNQKKENKKKPASSRWSPAMQKAIAEAENAPQQPFWSPWLWLLGFAFLMFIVSLNRPKPNPVDEDSHDMGWFSKIAFRFTFCYWLLYNFPFPFNSLLAKWYGQLFAKYVEFKNEIVKWTGQNVFRIQDELVLPNGSGDTTFSYITIFVIFIFTIFAAMIWSVVEMMIAKRSTSETGSVLAGRKTNYAISADLLRSYLRYVLAFWMLSYGLGKVAFVFNQFSPVSEYQLTKTWGDSSPMNVLWAFMGSSQAYTIFAGAGEVTGALLLIWRRTALLGSLVTFGVMFNVMMLNYCYDIPVKLFSTHLVVMSVYLILQDWRKLINLLILHRVAKPTPLVPPYTNTKTIWIQRSVKLLILYVGFATPIYEHCYEQAEYLTAVSQQPEFFGQYQVVSIKRDGNRVPATDHGWLSVRFAIEGSYGENYERSFKNLMIVGHKTFRRVQNQFLIEDQPDTLIIDRDTSQGILPTGQVKIESLNDDQIKLTGSSTRGNLEVVLKRNDGLYRLTGRGYRWINEIPFNR